MAQPLLNVHLEIRRMNAAAIVLWTILQSLSVKVVPEKFLMMLTS